MLSSMRKFDPWFVDVLKLHLKLKSILFLLLGIYAFGTQILFYGITDFSNKVGNISGVKNLVISSLPGIKAAVLLSAYQMFDNPKIHIVSETYRHIFR